MNPRVALVVMASGLLTSALCAAAGASTFVMFTVSLAAMSAAALAYPLYTPPAAAAPVDRIRALSFGVGALAALLAGFYRWHSLLCVAAGLVATLTTAAVLDRHRNRAAS